MMRGASRAVGLSMIVFLFVAAGLVGVPFGTAFTTDGLRVDLCGPAAAPSGAPMGFIGRLTVSDQVPSRVAPFEFQQSLDIAVDGEVVGWRLIRADGWFLFGLSGMTPGEHVVTASYPFHATPLAQRSWTVTVTEGPHPEGLSVEIACYLAYRDVSYAEMYVVVGGLLGNETASSDRASVGGAVQIDAGQACWTSVGLCDQTIQSQAEGFAVLVESSDWLGAQRPWAAWAGPFHYWAGTAPTHPGCAPTLWVSVDAWVDVEGKTFHAATEELQRDVCDRIPGSSS